MTESAERAPGLGKGMPTYIALDVSKSMQKHEKLLNETLAKIIKELYLNPRVSEFVHLSIITFSSEPAVVVKMTELTRMRQMPVLRCQGGTNFGPLFEMLRDRIDIDVPLLQDKGYSVLRPVVFLLTDGAPTDRPTTGWQEAHRALVDEQWRRHPRIISFGFGEAVEAVLRGMSTVQTYMADPALGDSTSALPEAMNGMLSSMVASVQARELRLPNEVAGYRVLSEDYVER
ncbi:vWA domain-containing protein [Actinomadura chokoriensis]|uniref:VWA domain-containing protein n=1 Tax=Actinomadura chokoriensis TaxID=454156 RepID=A0ABV4QY82_9ACTN